VVTIENTLLSELRGAQYSLTSGRRLHPADHRLIASRALGRLERCFQRPLRVGVLGDENSGKSLLINYLLKHQVLPSGGFADDNTAVLIRYAEEPSVHAIAPDGSRNRLTSKAFGKLIKPETRAPAKAPSVIYDASRSESASAAEGQSSYAIFNHRKKASAPARVIEVRLPLRFLKRIEFVEMRGYPEKQTGSPASAVFRQIGMTIWCTLATQAWKETEALAWKRIPPVHRQGALMLVTYKDAVRREKDQAKIRTRLHKATRGLFDEVALVSLRDAVQSLIAQDGGEADRLRAESEIETVETALGYMIQTWQIRRLHKASRIIRMIGTRLGSALAADPARPCNRDVAIRLERLAKDFMHASPSISFAVEAA